uniref:Uncharacterized protein n=1 Tax=Sphaerodactylus townsendi TaxID=933632 RepID=A0ACB8GE70_9SAUR
MPMLVPDARYGSVNLWRGMKVNGELASSLAVLKVNQLLPVVANVQGRKAEKGKGCKTVTLRQEVKKMRNKIKVPQIPEQVYKAG